MTYTLNNIQTAPSYDALKRNGFTDFDCVAYYGTSIDLRPTMFKQIKLGIMPQATTVQPKPQATNTIDRRALFNEVEKEFRRLMSNTFEYKGVKYNLLKLGYSFGWNNNKTRFGVHKMRMRKTRFDFRECSSKRIELSKYMLDHSTKKLEDWVNTILHEIGHAIDAAIRGRSSHDWHWVSVAKHIGCDGERCGDFEVASTAPSKYTIVCDNCGKKSNGHKNSRTITQGRRACGKCCKKYNGGVYSDKFKLRQIQNY